MKGYKLQYIVLVFFGLYLDGKWFFLVLRFLLLFLYIFLTWKSRMFSLKSGLAFLKIIFGSLEHEQKKYLYYSFLEVDCFLFPKGHVHCSSSCKIALIMIWEQNISTSKDPSFSAEPSNYWPTKHKKSSKSW